VITYDTKVEGRAFLVLGPESTGTRLATRILTLNGCEGSDDHSQPFDISFPPITTSPLIVYRQSVPHLDNWLNLRDLLNRCKHRDVIVIVTTRDWYCTVKSQVKHNLATDECTANDRLQRAYCNIFQELARWRVNYLTLSYESLTLHPRLAQLHLLTQLGLLMEHEVNVTNENTKHHLNTG
jgi:hypothetical protein